ncbi:MAG: VTT domain-containing protein [Burkholderiaceae bacterium]
MELIHFVIDFILHVDRYIETFVQNNGAWVYALLFVIVFVETGLVIMPFLPGDSLLFIVGALCGAGMMNLPLALGLLWVAAILGDQCNYLVGQHLGQRILQMANSRWFNRKAYDSAHDFYERHGAITIVIARFMPFIRTFAPFVAGVAHMSRQRFSLFNVLGGTIWVVGIGLAGYFFGNIEWVQKNFEKIIWAMILGPGIIVIVGGWHASRIKKEVV